MQERLAAWVTPLTWAGSTSRTHPHLWGAVLLGFAAIAPPVLLGLLRPGRAWTRHIIAAGQMVSTALLIHLSGVASKRTSTSSAHWRSWPSTAIGA